MKNHYYIIKRYIIFLIVAMFACSQTHADWKRVLNINGDYIESYLLEVVFLESDLSYGWCCGYDGVVLYTTDGGENWVGTTVYTDGLKRQNAGQLESIRFVNKDVGYTSGTSGIYKSTDGGKNWNNITPEKGTAYWGNYFVDENTGVVIGGNCFTGLQRFFRTEDGGKTWSEFRTVIKNTALTDLILYSADGLGYAASSGLIWITEDGGKTWDTYSLTGNNDWQEELAINGNSILVPVSGNCEGGFGGGVRMSVNMGKKWKRTDLGEQMYGSFLINEQKGYVCGMNKSVYYTIDGGDNWILDVCGIDDTASLDDIYFTDDTTGWVVGSGIYKTHVYDMLHPEIASENPVYICEGETIKLKTRHEYERFLWSNGSSSPEIIVSDSGTYNVIVANTDCDSAESESIKVLFHPKPEIEFRGDTNFCDGESAYIEVDDIFDGYIWKRDSSVIDEGKNEFSYDEGGNYTLSVVDSNGCQWDYYFTFTKRPNPELELEIDGTLEFCIGDTTILSAGEGFSSYRWLEDSTGTLIAEGPYEIKVSSTGYYYATVTNEYGCVGNSDTIYINVKKDTNALALEVEGDKLDFGKVSLSERLCLPVKITNILKRPHTINNIFVYRNIEFSIPQSQFPITIPPKGSISVEVCFYPYDLLNEYDTLLIDDNCWGRQLPLEGIGLENIYDGESRCKEPFKISTTGFWGLKFLAGDIPYPNPSSGKVKLSYFISSPDNKDIFTSCEMYNIFGEKVLSGIKKKFSETEEKDTFFEKGEYVFDATNIPNGAYIIHLKSSFKSEYYPLIIRK